jgi:surface protein
MMKRITHTIALLFLALSLSAQAGLWLQRTQAAPGTATDFRIVVKTDNAGVSNSDQFNFTGALGDYDVEVYDEAGTTLQETITGLSDAATITIAGGAGTYELRVFPSATNGFNRIQFNNGGDRLKLLEIRNWGDVAWADMMFAYRGCSNMVSVSTLAVPNTTSVTDMSNMFEDCKSLTTLDVSGFNTTSVTSMVSMFRSCTSLTTLDVSGFNTTSVTSMAVMFRSCTSLTTLDVSGFNTTSVTSMGRMFLSCTSLTDITGIENFTIASVTNFTSFLLGVTLPTSRYDNLLINYEAQAPNTGLNFHSGNSQYTAGGAAEAARTNLINTYNWTITDGGVAP